MRELVALALLIFIITVSSFMGTFEEEEEKEKAEVYQNVQENYKSKEN